MERKQSGTGPSLVAAGLALSLAVLTFSTIYFFLKRTWWFPEPISAFAESIDRQFGRTLFITGVVFFLAQLALGYVIFRYRDRGGRAHYSHGNTMLEILWTSATAVMFIGLGLAAVAVGREAELPASAIACGLAEPEGLPMRMQLERWGEITALVDCYNANPDSV